MKKKSVIRFADKKLKKSFESLKNSNEDDKKLYSFINRALDDLEENAFCGIQIPKKQIPKEYIKKYKIDNCWKYNLPGAWRLIYSVVSNNEIEIISLVLDWFNHPNYCKKFNYKKK
jgi:Txe/YoeB family toxin of Txe-Axe toxin-antitoxin module